MENLEEMLKHALVLLNQVFLAHKHVTYAYSKVIKMQKCNFMVAQLLSVAGYIYIELRKIFCVIGRVIKPIVLISMPSDFLSVWN